MVQVIGEGNEKNGNIRVLNPTNILTIQLSFYLFDSYKYISKITDYSLTKKNIYISIFKYIMFLHLKYSAVCKIMTDFRSYFISRITKTKQFKNPSK